MNARSRLLGATPILMVEHLDDDDNGPARYNGDVWSCVNVVVEKQLQVVWPLLLLYIISYDTWQQAKVVVAGAVVTTSTWLTIKTLKTRRYFWDLTFLPNK
jgi:hypothetical protein